MNEAFNVDCMEYMRTLPDHAFDLAVVDPPYGDGSGGNPERFGGRFDRYKGCNLRAGGGTWGKKYGNQAVAWDVAPPPEYFAELFRVSRNQIIWGGNYFALPPCRCFLVWRKLSISEAFSMAMVEYAWTSFKGENAKLFECTPQGKKDDQRFHPTQKPVALYSWIFRSYATPGMKILDTHLGSGSSRIAAFNAGLDFVGCEIDPDYFRLQEERFARATAQCRLFFDEPTKTEQLNLLEGADHDR